MNNLALNSILYIAFRLAPFIIVSYFVLSSIFSGDIKGFLFLGLLLINCIITIGVGNMMSSTGSMNPVCNALNLTQTGPLSQTLPLNINVFGFTFAYLLYIITKYGLVSSNWPTLLFFPLLIVFQLWWSHVNSCSSMYFSGISLSIGVVLGIMFSSAIDASNITEMQYFNGISNANVCKTPSRYYLKCNST
jgi:hypothetical protein